MAGVLFVICVPTEKYENSVKKPKKEIIIGDYDTEKLTEGSDQSMLSKQHFSLNSSQEKLIPMSEDSSISDVSQKKSAMPKSKSVDLLNTSSPKKGLRQNKSWDCNEILNSSAASNKFEEKHVYDDDNMPLEKVLRMILEEEKIKNAVWTKGESGNYLQVIFPLESGNQCEGTLAVLNQYGIGQRLNSVVSVIPCSLYYKDSDKSGLNEEELEKEIKREHAKNTAWNRFVSSVRARLTVAQVVEGVKANAALTFDFLILLIIASILSAMSLAENNNVYLVSSMLISPMMGPVMAGTFGRVIQDKELQKIGVLNELLGLGLATAIGFCYGLIITSFTDRYGDGDWPTYEMTSRGETRTLWVGCLIALLSGAAVALGILGDNIASLVGVAISTSLMPPAVNAGLLWAMAVVYAFAGEYSSKSMVRSHIYSNDDVWELAALGGISMCLTFGNIVCIYLAGILVFKIKEVVPLSSKDHSRRFWKYDIKIARDYNRTLQDEDAKIITKRLSNEISGFKGSKYESLFSAGEKSKSDQLQEFADHLCQSTELVREHIININKMQNTWSPSTFTPRKPTIQELKNVYFSMVDDKRKVQRSLNFRFPVSKSLQPTSWTNPATSQQPVQNEGNILPCIPENTKNDSIYKGQTSQSQISSSQLSTKFFTGTKKFVVTPASIDDLS